MEEEGREGERREGKRSLKDQALGSEAKEGTDREEKKYTRALGDSLGYHVGRLEIRSR